MMKRMTNTIKNAMKMFARIYCEAMRLYGEALINSRGFTCA